MKTYAFPDFQTSITALGCSVLKHYGCAAPNPSLPEADALLSDTPGNVVLFLFDGLGEMILSRHLPEDSFLRRHQMMCISSVFPPTTAAAATALETARFPSQSGWLGWSIFWPPLGKNVALYPNTGDDGTPAASVHIGNTFLAAEPITGRIRQKQGISSLSVHGTGDLCAKELPDVLNHIRTLCREPGPHFVYGYVNEPDHLLHKTGCFSQAVHDYLLEADRQMERLAADCSDTLFFLTADHGFTDIRGICLEDYPDLAAALVRPPSIEPRAMNLFVKPEYRADFPALWQEAAGDAYQLYTHAQVLKAGLFGPGPAHLLLEEMLGDYLAVARTELTMFPTRTYLQSMVATHGGMTPQELTVPLIAFRTHSPGGRG